MPLCSVSRCVGFWGTTRIRTKMGHLTEGEDPFGFSCSILRFVAFLSFLLGLFWIKGHLIGERFGRACAIHVIEAKADQMVCHIGTEGCYRFRINAVSFTCQLV